MKKFTHMLVVLCAVLMFASVLGILATGTQNDVLTPTVVYTVGTVQQEGSIHVDDFSYATAALREKNRQWKADDVVEIQFVGQISGGAEDGVLFRLETIWREDGTKLPIIIRGAGALRDDASIYLDGVGGWYACANDYTFVNLSMPIGTNNGEKGVTEFYAGSGNIRFENVEFKPKTVRVPSAEAQNAMHMLIKRMTQYMWEDPDNLITPDVSPVPVGDAWKLARDTNWEIGEGLYGTDGNYYGDYLHDGNTGGGQYLNGCIYFEVLTGMSCIGNTWRPSDYTLDEDKVTFLQNIAHETVLSIYGEDHYKNPVTDVVGNDGWMNVLIMGSSNNAYLREETCAIAATAGVNMRLVHAYYSGVPIATQWGFIENDSKEYTVYFNENFTVLDKMEKQAYTDYAKLYNWDAIVTYQSSNCFYSEIMPYLEDSEAAFAAAMEKVEKADDLYNHVYENSGVEGTKYYWYQNAAQCIGAGSTDDAEHGKFFADTPTSAVFEGWDELEAGERVTTSITFGDNIDYQSYGLQIGAVGYLQEAPATPFTAVTAAEVKYPDEEGYENIPDIRPIDVDAKIIADGDYTGLGRIYCKIGYAPSNGTIILKNGTVQRCIGTTGGIAQYGDISMQFYGGVVQDPVVNKQNTIVTTNLTGDAELIVDGAEVLYGFSCLSSGCTLDGDMTIDVRDGSIGYRFYPFGSGGTNANITGTATFHWSGGHIERMYYGRGVTINKLVNEFSTNPDAVTPATSSYALPLYGYSNCVVTGDICNNFIGQIPAGILSRITFNGGDNDHTRIINTIKADANGNVHIFASFCGGITTGTVREIVNNIEAGNFTAFNGGSTVATGTTKITNNISGGTFSANTVFGGADNATVNTVITGGTFAFDPTENVAEGYEAVENEDGTFTVENTFKPGLFIAFRPLKTVYNVGEALDIDGLILKLVNEDGTEEYIDEGYTATGFDSSAAGKTTVTITYGEKTVELGLSVIDETINVVDNSGNVYTDFTDAVADCEEDGMLTLQQDVAENVTVNKDLCIDLNGKEIDGTITVADGCTLYGADANTDDYTIEDADGYTKIKVERLGSGKVEGLPADVDPEKDGYLMVTEGEYVSFHRVNLKVTDMTLRSSAAGVYFKSAFAGDELVADRVKQFGIVMSIVGEPTEGNLKSGVGFSWFDGANFEAGVNMNDATSTLLKGVMKETNASLINKRNANLPVYGRAYVLLEDGTYMLGKTVVRTFREQVEGADAIWDTLTAEQKLETLKMYSAFKNVMADWEIPHIKTEEEAFSVQNIFDYAQYENDDTVLPYRIHVPYNYDSAKEYPLLLSLHGAGYRGDNNTRQLNALGAMFKLPGVDMDQVIIVAPQCPSDQKWVDTDWSLGSYDLDNTPESNELKAVMELMDIIQETYSVDENRIYACGFSMGGYGTWNVLMNHSDRFAAAIAMCGAADPSKAGLLVDTPIWAIHGAKDPTVPVSGSQEMVAAIEAAGGTKIKYTELPNAEHDVWTYTYSNSTIFKWLLSQSK